MKKVIPWPLSCTETISIKINGVINYFYLFPQNSISKFVLIHFSSKFFDNFLCYSLGSLSCDLILFNEFDIRIRHLDRDRLTNGSDDNENQRAHHLKIKCDFDVFFSKIENLVKNRKFSQKSKIWSKIENLVKNRKFGQKSNIWSKIENLVKNRKFGQK